MSGLYDWERCDHDSIGQPGCVTCDPDRHRVAARLQYRSQKFFADLALETRKPHFGDHHKTYVAALLLRAQEAGLYTPDKEQS